MDVATDSLTLTFIIIAIVIAVMSLMMAVNNRKRDAKLRRVVRHMSLMQRSEMARELCRKVMSINPDLCAGIDYTLKENGDGIEIDEWNTHHPRP